MGGKWPNGVHLQAGTGRNGISVPFALGDGPERGGGPGSGDDLNWRKVAYAVTGECSIVKFL